MSPFEIVSLGDLFQCLIDGVINLLEVGAGGHVEGGVAGHRRIGMNEGRTGWTTEELPRRWGSSKRVDLELDSLTASPRYCNVTPRRWIYGPLAPARRRRAPTKELKRRTLPSALPLPGGPFAPQCFAL